MDTSFKLGRGCPSGRKWEFVYTWTLPWGASTMWVLRKVHYRRASEAKISCVINQTIHTKKKTRNKLCDKVKIMHVRQSIMFNSRVTIFLK